MKGLMFISTVSFRSFVLVVLVLSVSAVSLGVFAQGAGRAVTLPKPEFRNDRGEKAYSLGLEHYKKKEYDKAKVQFKKAEKGAKTKKDKNIVKKWTLCSEAAKSLAYLRKRANSGKMIDSYFRAADFLPKLVGTPIHPEFKQFVEELGDRAFHIVEAFDAPSLSYSKKYGKNFVKDPKIVKFGGGCLHWAQTKDFRGWQLKFKSAPRNLAAYDGIMFWVLAKRPTKMFVGVETAGEGKKQTDGLTGKQQIQNPAFRKEFIPPKGRKWQKVFLPFSGFDVFAEPDWNQVTKLYIAALKPKSKFDIYIDEVVLVRKDPKAKPSKKKKKR